MVSFRGKKRTWAAPTSVSFSGFNSKFPTSIPTPFICGVSPPPGMLHAIRFLTLRAQAMKHPYHIPRVLLP